MMVENTAGGGGDTHRPSTLRACRLLAGHTQQQLAELAGIDRRTLGALEAERSRPQLKTAQRLAECLQLDVATLFPPSGERG